MNVDIFALDATSVVFVVGALVPLLVDLITKRYTTTRVKTVANAVASVVLGGLVYLVGADGSYDWRGFANGAANVFLISLLSYLGWKGVGVTGKDGVISRATGQRGIGTAVAPVPATELPATSGQMPTTVAEADVAAPEPHMEVGNPPVEYEGRHEAGLTQTGLLLVVCVIALVVILIFTGALSIHLG